MTDIPEGEPLTEYASCPGATALWSTDFKVCLYGAPEAAALTPRPGIRYVVVQPDLQVEEST